MKNEKPLNWAIWLGHLAGHFSVELDGRNRLPQIWFVQGAVHKTLGEDAAVFERSLHWRERIRIGFL